MTAMPDHEYRHPVRTSLDARYSADAASPTPWSVAKGRLIRAGVTWVVTCGRDGGPHATPVVPVVDGDRLFFHTGTAEVKYANILRWPQVLVLAGDTCWEQGLDVVYAGRAVPVADPATLERLIERWREKWDGRWSLERVDGNLSNRSAKGNPQLVAFEVVPTRAYAFRKGPLTSHTTYAL